MSIEPVKSRAVSTQEARNGTLASDHYNKNIDNTQFDQARLEDQYQLTLMGGNRFDLFDYSKDQQSLTQQIANAMNLRTENHIAAKEAMQAEQENQKARGSDGMLEIAKG